MVRKRLDPDPYKTNTTSIRNIGIENSYFQNLRCVIGAVFKSIGYLTVVWYRYHSDFPDMVVMVVQWLVGLSAVKWRHLTKCKTALPTNNHLD